MNTPLRLPLAALACAAVVATSARADDTASGVHLENANVIAHGDTINCYAVPVAGADGTVKTYDVELHLTVGADGTVKADATKATPVPIPDDTRHFLAGEYVCVAGDQGTMTVTGPTMSPSGRAVYTFVTTAKGGGGNPMNFGSGGTWVTGPAEGNPMLEGVSKEIVLPKNVSFGRQTETSFLLGVQQLGDKLMITPFQILPTTLDRRGSIIFQRKPPEPAAN